MNKGQVWTKNFLAATLTNFFVTLNFFLLMVITAAFAMENFDSTPSEAGLAASIYVLGALVARLIAGKWIERTGRKRMLFIGLILGFVAALLYFAIDGIISLYVIRFLHGAGFGVATTAAATIVASIVPQERRGEGLGYFLLSGTLATAIGPFLSIFFSERGGFSVVFVVCAVAAALSVLSGLLISVSEMELTKEQIKEMKGFKLSNFFEASVIPISLVGGALYFSYSSILSFFTPYAKEINLVDAASFFFVVIAVVMFITRPFTGRLFDSKGENFIMYPAFLMFVVGMIVLSQAQYGYILLLAGVFLGLAMSVIQSSGQAIAVKIAPEHRLGLANSTYYVFVDAGVGVGPFVLGLFIPFTGYRGLYMGMAVIGLACVFLYHHLHGKRAAVAEGRNITHPVN